MRNEHYNVMCCRRIGKAFTLIELLVVVAIIGLLVSILMPSLAKARELARSAVCKSNLHSIGAGLVLYQTQNDDCVVPSYNMTGVTGGATVPLDGWAPILDRDGLLLGGRSNTGSAFVCPSMIDVEGMATGQTGSDPNRPKGWMDWPFTRNGNANIAVTIPERGFNRILRVGYWINSDNPIGAAEVIKNDIFYTCSVGYGPGSNGVSLRTTKASAFTAPSRLIALADGVYAGRQRDARRNNKRVGYRHGSGDTANIALADGHVESARMEKFPRADHSTNPSNEVLAENLNGLFTVYADPLRTLVVEKQK